MEHPFTPSWWNRQRTVAFIALLIVFYPTGASTDSASFIGQVLGVVVVLWALVWAYNQASGWRQRRREQPTA